MRNHKQKDKMTKRFSRGCGKVLTALLLCFVMAFSVIQVGAATKEELQNKISGIEGDLAVLAKQREAIEADIQDVKGDKAETAAKQGYVSEQVQITQAEINSLQDKITALEENIEIKLEEIELKQADYDASFALFQRRVRAMSMYDDTTTLGLVLGTDNFVDFLTTTDTISRIAEHDNDLMDSLEAERVALEKEKVSLEADKKSLEADMATVASKKQELATQQATLNAQMENISALEQQYTADLAANQAKSAEMESNIQSIYSQIKLMDNPYVGGTMQWPVPNYYQITSYYGWRFNNSDYHTGMDISGGGVNGKPVVAANGGVIAKTNYAFTPGRGYGIYVIIDHGGKTTTLYGHLSSISVSEGQSVTKGQQIGLVGSTGWSTGPHLHFEVRENNKHVNPLPYVQG